MANNGIDGPGPNNAAITADQSEVGNSTTVPKQTGTWADQTDVRPTILALVGLTDDKTDDGVVLYQDLTITPNGTNVPGNASTSDIEQLSQCYKQLNASVGQFGNDVIVADNAALRTGSATDDSTYQTFLAQLKTLGSHRDADATTTKNDLASTEFGPGLTEVQDQSDLAACNGDLVQADALVASVTPPPNLPEAPGTPVLLVISGAVFLAGLFIVRRRPKRRSVTVG